MTKRTVIVRWIIVAFVIILLEFLAEFLYFNKVNQSPLLLETIDGTGQAYHPSVLFFNEPWHGYRYWMAETPYPINIPPYRDRWECPSIHVSNDGYNWTLPNGLSNPIDDLLPLEIKNKDFFSDPHLVYKEGHLECFYRYSKATEEGYHTFLVRKISEDGINWQKREQLLDFCDTVCDNTVGDMVRSPAVIWQDFRYKMWFVDNVNPKGTKHVCYSESIDGQHWSERQVCFLEGDTINPWHLDLNYLDGVYLLTIYDFHNLTLWKSYDGVSFVYLKQVLSPSGVYGSFYSDGLYRSSIIKDMAGYKLYFSAFDDSRTYIGLMEGTDLDTLSVSSVNGPYKSLIDFFKPFAMIWKVRLWNLYQTLQKNHR